jgi:glucose-6-phosphate isomerase
MQASHPRHGERDDGAAEGASSRALWHRYQRYRCDVGELEISLDISRMRFEDDFLERMSTPMSEALAAMTALEAGAMANVDERRMVGHYWLREPELAPTAQLRASIETGLAGVLRFSRRVHDGDVRGGAGGFRNLVHVGIGGSALGPQLICGALESPDDRLSVHFLDNADPDGIDRLLSRIGADLGRTMISIVSKSGWTPTTRHVLVELEAAYGRRGLDLGRHAVATTMAGTALDVYARDRGWLATFPMWDWVGGRTSVTSAVGLLPAALQGIDVKAFLGGAATMDRATRIRDPRRNPAALLALMWYRTGEGRGLKRMVLLPYKDRLSVFPRYVQQLVMESIGKRLDRSGAVVHQGLTVYGHKGSTDQHSYLQQLRDGAADFFVTFIRCQRERTAELLELEPGATLGDYLFGYLEATRDALYDRGRDSITISVPEIGPASLGGLIGLYERAVGLYAELIDVNAYHQPGVDKAAAAGVVALLRAVVDLLAATGSPLTAGEVAESLGRPDQEETVYKVLEHLAADTRRGVGRHGGATPFDARFRSVAPLSAPPLTRRRAHA